MKRTKALTVRHAAERDALRERQQTDYRDTMRKGEK